MTSLTTTISNNTYWNSMSNDSRAYFDDFPKNLTDDVDFTHFMDTLIKEQHQENLSSPEVDQRTLQASSTNSPPTESYQLNLICGVCGAPAHGYNFDQITCESCKAFFRRNALKNTTDLKCRFSGCCVINVATRRQCTYCRLKKCFDIKMRKDWIRTEEERILRRLKKLSKQDKKFNKLSSEQQLNFDCRIVVRNKKRILPLLTKSIETQERALQIVQTIYPVSTFAIHRSLCDDDKILLNNIINAHKIGAAQADLSHITRYTSNSSLSQFVNDESVNHQSLILFFKQIPEFKLLDLDDQILLIKCNMIDIIHLHQIIIQNFHESSQIGEQMSRWIGPDFHEQMSGTRHKFDCFMRYPVVLQIALIVFVFSINLSTPRGSTQYMDYKNKRKLLQCQDFYMSLLWRYLVYLFDENDAIRSIETIVMQILRYQLLMTKMDQAFQREGKQAECKPLMQSVFGLT